MRIRSAVLGIALAVTAGLVPALAAVPAQAAIVAKTPPLTTPWTGDVSKTNPLPDYPRPQMTRAPLNQPGGSPVWQSLNGEWEFLNPAVASDGSVNRNAAPPLGQTLPERVLVPYPIESALSGIQRNDDRDLMFYRRTFTVPAAWNGQRVQLHFGAVDYEATVWVNGTQVAFHRGGYDRFETDITGALRSGSNEIVVRVYDPSEKRGELQPTGKQVAEPDGGIFYTPSSGIWQTVWMEPTPASSIYSVDIVPNITAGTARVRVFTRGDVSGYSVLAEALSGTAVVGQATGGFTEFTVPVPSPHLWSPEDPYLYDLRVTLRNAQGAAVDRTTDYFGMREVGTKMIDGVLRPTLNGQFVYQIGTLDQGFWPDGLYTAPTDDALKSDIQKHKALGFNMVRKHAKVEPARWYYYADTLGLLVWQDLPTIDPDGPPRSDAAITEFESEGREIVDEHRFSPAVVTYVTANEGWGENSVDETRRYSTEIKNYDPSRLVDAHSGYNCCHTKGNPNSGDIDDLHVYPGPVSPTPSSTRVAVLGEFGGLGLRTPGHEYSPDGNFFAYEDQGNATRFNERYTGMVRDLKRLMTTKGLSASVYTELTDVEGEYNGLFTYDRKVQKVDTAQLRAVHAELIAASRNLNAPQQLTLGDVRTFRVTTSGYTNRSLRHSNSLARTDAITAASSDTDRQDASFRVATGLGDPRCYSFESVDFPGKYLRTSANRVRIDSDTGGAFAADATWCSRPGLASGGISFESLSTPGSYLRHFSDAVYAARSGGPNVWDTADSFAADATWNLSQPALWRSSASLPTDARRSLQVTTYGLTDRYVRHAQNLAYTDPVGSGSDGTTKQDATFTIRRGLSDSSCYSFESVNYPGRYLRHQAFRVQIAPSDGTSLWRDDATWCARPALGTAQGAIGVSLESFNNPGSFMRHNAGQVFLADGKGVDGNRPETFSGDTSFVIAAPWAP